MFHLSRLTASIAATLALCHSAWAAPIATTPGMPPVVNASNLYSEAGAGRLSPNVATALPRIAPYWHDLDCRAMQHAPLPLFSFPF